MESTEPDVESREAELRRLRARVARLEAELAEQAARTNRVVAAAEERAYWLDRWHLDLNALMRRRGAARLRAGGRALRAACRRARPARGVPARQAPPAAPGRLMAPASVVIPVRDGARYLGELLAALA